MTVARFLRSKARPPLLDRDAVERPRLTDALAASNDRAWLVSAPAGYGKTTLVLQAIDRVDGDVAWISVDRADNDPVRFWSHLAAAVLDGTDRLDPVLDALESGHTQAVIDEIVATIEQRDRRCFVVLDDVHEVHNRAILDALGLVLHRPPENLTLVLVTRADPPLPIGRLRSHGELLEVRSNDLAFTADEAAMVLGDKVAAAVVTDVVARTEGWATALRMLAVSAGPSRTVEQLLEAAGDAERDLADFLAGEVLGTQDEATQRFLIETSILWELTPELCDHLSGQRRSLAILRDLVRRHVFTSSIDHDNATFRYHPLFREFLAGRALELPRDHLAELHCTAARWHAARDQPTPTIHHAVAAGDLDLALLTIMEHFLPYSQRGQWTTVESWLDMYGLERCREHRDLRLVAAWAALNTRRYDEIEDWLDLSSGRTEDDRYLVETHAIRSHRARHQGDLATALAEADRSGEFLTDPDSIHATVVHAVRGMARVLAGDDATDVLNLAIDVGHLHDVDSSIVIGHCFLAVISARDPERLDEAEAHADQALRYCATPALERFHQPVVALVVKGEAALSRGLTGDATELANRAEKVADDGAEPLMAVMANCLQARVAHRLGHFDEARAAIRTAKQNLGENGGQGLHDLVRRTANDTRFVVLDQKHLPPGAVELTDRELAVLRLLPHRLRRRQLAEQLFVSENTVKTHLTSIRHKLGVSKRDEVVARARDLGLLPDTD